MQIHPTPTETAQSLAATGRSAPAAGASAFADIWLELTNKEDTEGTPDAIATTDPDVDEPVAPMEKALVQAEPSDADRPEREATSPKTEIVLPSDGQVAGAPDADHADSLSGQEIRRTAPNRSMPVVEWVSAPRVLPAPETAATVNSAAPQITPDGPQTPFPRPDTSQMPRTDTMQAPSDTAPPAQQAMVEPKSGPEARLSMPTNTQQERTAQSPLQNAPHQMPADRALKTEAPGHAEARHTVQDARMLPAHTQERATPKAILSSTQSRNEAPVAPAQTPVDRSAAIPLAQATGDTTRVHSRADRSGPLHPAAPQPASTRPAGAIPSAYSVLHSPSTTQPQQREATVPQATLVRIAPSEDRIMPSIRIASSPIQQTGHITQVATEQVTAAPALDQTNPMPADPPKIRTYLPARAGAPEQQVQQAGPTTAMKVPAPLTTDVSAQSDPTLHLPADAPVAPQSAPAEHRATQSLRPVLQQVVDVMPRGPNKSVDIAMNPEELGRVRMSVTAQEGALTVAIHVDRPETLDLMRRNIDALAQEYRDIGYDDVAFDFTQNQPRDESGQDTQNGPASDTDVLPHNTPDLIMTPLATVAGGVDIRI